MLLRKHLIGAKLTGIRQPGLERLLCFDFDGTNSAGEAVRLCLCAEFMGRHSNALLLREDAAGRWMILDALKRMDVTEGALRPILPGLPYQLPPGQGKLYLPTASTSEILQKTGDGLLSDTVEGLAPLVARALGATAQSIEFLREIAETGEGEPLLFRDPEGNPAQFGFCALALPGMHSERAESYSALLEIFYAQRGAAQRLAQQGGELRALLQNGIARATRKLAIRRTELAASEDREQLRICAELIFANRAQLDASPAVRGQTAYLLENYYDGGKQLTVPVVPALTPAANAQRYFKEYRKQKAANQHLGSLIAQGELELEYLESALEHLRRAQGQAALEALRTELEEQGYCKRKAGKGAKKGAGKRPPLPPLEYRTTAGLRVLVGRSNTQNDQLSLRVAKGHDLWFHAQGCPGSHAILVTEGVLPDEGSIQEAAALALLHSKAAGGGGAVDYTQARQLKKPPGAPPGKVIYHSHQTLWVYSDPNSIKHKEAFHGRD
jgi:predicted ribosome quality control (RQC) complex YloA/Tae2 family protein